MAHIKQAGNLKKGPSKLQQVSKECIRTGPCRSQKDLHDPQGLPRRNQNDFEDGEPEKLLVRYRHCGSPKGAPCEQ